MTETLLALIPAYGLWFMGVVTYLSCFGIPVPTSLLLLAAGGFVASGDFVPWQVAATSYIGAVLGDQSGYLTGRLGRGVLTRLKGHPTHGKMVSRATDYVQRRGGVAVFLSRWLLSPLGPYVNLAGGAAHLAHHRFTLASAAGEALWVAGYLTLGFTFADDIVALADMLGSASGLLAALAVLLGAGLWLRRALNERQKKAG